MPANPLTDPHWATETTDRLVTLIETVRSQTTQKLVYAARGIVFGLIALIVGSFALVILIVMLMRALQSLIELATTWERAVYLSYLILGAILTLVGMVLFKKRNSSTAP
jgi:H+/Cl- antiporter ClcA